MLYYIHASTKVFMGGLFSSTFLFEANKPLKMVQTYYLAGLTDVPGGVW